MIIAFRFRLRGTSGSAFLSGDTKTSLLLQVLFSKNLATPVASFVGKAIASTHLEK